MSNPPQIVTVTAASATYDVHIGTGLIANLAGHIAALTSKPGAKPPSLFVVTSPEISELHGDTLTDNLSPYPVFIEILSGEQYKRLTTIEFILDSLASNGADRDSILIAFGGGVIGDMTGFAAAIYMRGIRYIGVPTTLLAQVDSSLGGKTGVNLASGKNLVGSFHHPLAVFADIDLLATLPPAELRAGLQESIKAGIIRDRALFDFLDTHSDAVLSGDPAALTEVVTASVRMKANVVAADERETGVRMLLNLGHTLGHAIESATNYTQLLHGEAVAWGMIAAIEIALTRGTITREEADRMTHVICRYGPLRPFKADAATLVANTAKDKKTRSGTRSFILPVGIGDATIVRDVTDEELLAAAQEIVLTASGAAE